MRQTKQHRRPTTSGSETAALWGRVVRDWQRVLLTRSLSGEGERPSKRS